jgi:signal transduction histidine kinase
LFVWFGVAIALTAVVAAGVFGVIGSPGFSSYERARTFLADQLAAVWDQPARRDALATAVARDFDVRVELRDSAGNVLREDGGRCTHGAMSAAIMRDGALLGEVQLCPEHRFRPRFLAPLLVSLVVLWGVSGAVARRLLRPLGELARVASDIGRGRLESRVRMGHHQGLEFSVVGNVMNEMASRIEKQLADQKALLATVSHEIRTPLSRMRLLIEFARGKTGPVGELEQLEGEITEIDTLVSDLLASSRIDFSAVTKSRLDAREIAETVLGRARVDVSRLSAPESRIVFQGDATLVTRAVQNLVDNAQKHGAGLDALRVEASPGFVSFIVEDRGRGLLPGEETRIFEPFYRRASGDGDTAGLGLGLALVKKVAEAHGGRVVAANREAGGGARLVLELARQPAD